MLLLQFRVPSGMRGGQHSVFENGIRNTLVVQGAGVKPGATDNTLIAISDIFPTMLDIAGVNATLPPGLALDGISFKSVLLRSSGSTKAGNKTTTEEDAAFAVQQQQSLLSQRYLFMLGPSCWGANAVPELGPDRWVRCACYIVIVQTGSKSYY
jgi:arylsulfatase A-like enzyme